MTWIIERVDAHYESRELPFGRTYEWYPSQVVLECDCGEKLTVTGTSATTLCRCGADHGAVIRREFQEREGRLRDSVTHPWHHDPREQAEQHLQDEAAYPNDSPWRYNDITTRNSE
jgi:hypothetical protein